jgi:hypothetical protein
MGGACNSINVCRRIELICTLRQVLLEYLILLHTLILLHDVEMNVQREDVQCNQSGLTSANNKSKHCRHVAYSI